MSGLENYIDRCIEVAASIDAEALGQLEVGAEIGNGQLFTMKMLGELSVLGADTSVGLKIPKYNPDYSASDLTELRFLAEQESICLLTESMPELTEEVPKFIVMVSIGQESPVALLTEEATLGGNLHIEPLQSIGSFTTGLADSIEAAFSGEPTVEVDKDVIEKSMQFMVGEQRRLLDFTPPPVGFGDVYSGEDVRDRIVEAIFERTGVVDVSPGSPLGRSLAEHVK